MATLLQPHRLLGTRISCHEFRKLSYVIFTLNIQNIYFKQIFLLEDDVNCGLTIYCSANAEAMGSNPVEVPKFFSGLFAIA